MSLDYIYLILPNILPSLEEAGLIEIDEFSTYGEGSTRPPYKVVDEMLGSLESIVNYHFD